MRTYRLFSFVDDLNIVVYSRHMACLLLKMKLFLDEVKISMSVREASVTHSNQKHSDEYFRLNIFNTLKFCLDLKMKMIVFKRMK